MMGKERIPTPNDAESKKTERKGLYDRYAGVCDVVNPEQARAMAEELRQNRKNPNRKIMIGSMAGHFSLRPEKGDPGGQRDVFPPREEISAGFTDDPDVLNTVHFADLYREKNVQTLLEDLELVVEFGGEHLHAIQLDVTWPEPSDLKTFKRAHPNLLIILQVGPFAFQETENNPQKMVDRLRAYDDSVDFVLLDMSMGKGISMNSEGLLPILRLIRKELPYLGLAVAGGLGPDSMDLLEPIAKEFPDISIDAQGRLKPTDTKADSLGHKVSSVPADPERSRDYIQKSCAMLDGQNESK